MGNIISFIPGRRLNNNARIYKDEQTQTNCETPFSVRFTQTEVKRQETPTQTEDKIRQSSFVQTALTLTEKLTHNNIQDVGSSELFEETCELCDERSEKEAVGYCRTCCQYMCLQCCKRHEATSVCKNHPIVSKAEFENLVKHTSLYTKKLAPVYPSSCFYTSNTNSSKIGVFNIPGSQCIFFWVPKKSKYFKNVCSLQTFDKQSGKCSSKDVDVSYEAQVDLCEVSKRKCSKSAYFVIAEDISDSTTSSDTTVYKYCPDHDKDTIRIAFKICGLSHSVVPFNGGLAMSVYFKTKFFTPTWNIRLVDVKGNIISQICYDDKGNRLFMQPRHLASSNIGDILFVSDCRRNSVTALDKHGHVLFKFTHELIARPLGITCDEENNVYVACKTTVVQIHKDGDKCRSILCSYQDIDIVDVCYNPVSKHLAVAENSPGATIFKFFP